MPLKKHSLLFTGHMIDAEDRQQPRFPANKEALVKDELYKNLAKQKEIFYGELYGIAGGASGGDILFHELCVELNIPSEIYLALPEKEFKKASVLFAGEGWAARFNKLIKKLPVHLLSEQSSIDNDKNVWVRANLWMLDTALQNGGDDMTLIALWDGKGGDGNGGTEHMVKTVKANGGAIIIVEINKI